MIFVTHNKNKACEIAARLPKCITIETLSDINFHEEIAETADTFEGNALIKAHYLYDRFHKPCFADDSGLEVDELRGAPGVYSARYSGEKASDMENNNKLLCAVKEIPNPHAQFRCVIAYIDKEGAEHIFEGIVRGSITHSPKGDKGFGYDPLFVPDVYPDKTFAELSLEEKNQISHRAQAVKRFVDYIKSLKA